MIKYVLQILLISLPLLSFGQASEIKRIYFDVTNKVPVQNAKVYYEEDHGTHLYSQSDGLIFEPVDDSVFSVSLSTVCAVFDIGNGQTIVTRDTLNRFYTYTNLKEVFFSKGDTITKGSLIGLIKNEDQKFNEFLFIVTDKKGRNWNGEKVWELIKDDSSSTVQVSDTTDNAIKYKSS